jgi:hypothetical protein
VCGLLFILVLSMATEQVIEFQERARGLLVDCNLRQVGAVSSTRRDRARFEEAAEVRVDPWMLSRSPVCECVD